jgi:hypothetical protein
MRRNISRGKLPWTDSRLLHFVLRLHQEFTFICALKDIRYRLEIIALSNYGTRKGSFLLLAIAVIRYPQIRPLSMRFSPRIQEWHQKLCQ